MHSRGGLASAPERMGAAGASGHALARIVHRVLGLLHRVVRLRLDHCHHGCASGAASVVDGRRSVAWGWKVGARARSAPAGLRRLPRHLRRDGTLATLPHSDPTSTSAQAQASAVHVYVCQRSSGMARGRAAARAGAHGARCSRGARRSAARSRPAAGAAGRGERSAGARARTSGALCNSCAPCSAPVQNALSFCTRCRTR